MGHPNFPTLRPAPWLWEAAHRKSGKTPRACGKAPELESVPGVTSQRLLWLAHASRPEGAADSAAQLGSLGSQQTRCLVPRAARVDAPVFSIVDCCRNRRRQRPRRERNAAIARSARHDRSTDSPVRGPTPSSCTPKARPNLIALPLSPSCWPLLNHASIRRLQRGSLSSMAPHVRLTRTCLR